MARMINGDAVKRRIWGIVETWKYQGRKYDALLLESVIAQIFDTQPTLTPPNEPLTIQQLREMDGEPVWFDTIKRWGIVKVCRDGVFVLTKSGEFEVGRCKYYRRPPEGKNV